VNIVGVTVVAGANCDYRFERWRPLRSELQTGKATPRNTDVSNGAAAPWLSGDPFDNVVIVVPFDREILIKEDAVGVSGSA
jgi:hypothetical protein